MRQTVLYLLVILGLGAAYAAKDVNLATLKNYLPERVIEKTTEKVIEKPVVQHRYPSKIGAVRNGTYTEFKYFTEKDGYFFYFSPDSKAQLYIKKEH